MSNPDGEGEEARGPLELADVLLIATNDGAALPFEVVGILEDPREGTSYAVLHREPADESDQDEFIVTDLNGELLGDDQLAQGILDDFLAFAEEGDGERAAHNGETD